MTLYVVLAIVGAVLVAVGVGMWAPAAGVAVAGVEAVTAGYVGAYAHVRRQMLEIDRR